MTYSAVQQPAGGGDLICKLSLAAAKNPFDRSSWQRLGPLFPVCCFFTMCTNFVESYVLLPFSK
jgi:hypothetical protein